MITGIWDNEYIQTLGVQDHCSEVIALYNEIRIIKGYSKDQEEKSWQKESVYKALNNEMMDLYLILEKWSEDKNTLKQLRLLKFKQKANETK